MKKINYRIFFFICAAFILTARSIRADDDMVGSMRLDYWAFGADGNVTVRGLSADLNDSNKGFDGNGNGFVFGAERKFDEWGLNMDFFWGDRTVDRQVSASQNVHSEFDFLILTAGGYMSLVQKEFEESDNEIDVDAYAGLRPYINNIKVSVETGNPNNDVSRSNEINWIDPYVGLGIKGRLGEAWALTLYGDLGGFSIGSASKLSVLTRTEIAWGPNPNFAVRGGYRFFDLETQHQNGDRQTVLDFSLGGPTLGAELKF